jgi:hypothetical protein
VSLGAGWQHIKGGSPGRRFQVALGFVPGIPGVILVFLGAAFISTQSRAVARALDWAEMRLRRMLRYS